MSNLKNHLVWKLGGLLLVSLALPLSILLYYTVDSFQSRRELLVQRALESQKNLLFELESYYRSDFLKSYQQGILESLKSLSSDFVDEFQSERLLTAPDSKKCDELYFHSFLPNFGYQISLSDERSFELERRLPLRQQWAFVSMSDDYLDFQEALLDSIRSYRLFSSETALKQQLENSDSTVSLKLKKDYALVSEVASLIRQLKKQLQLRRNILEKDFKEAYTQELLSSIRPSEFKNKLILANGQEAKELSKLFFEKRLKLLKTLLEAKRNHNGDPGFYSQFLTNYQGFYGKDYPMPTYLLQFRNEGRIPDNQWDHVFSQVDPWRNGLYPLLSTLQSKTEDVREFLSLIPRTLSDDFILGSSRKSSSEFHDLDWKGIHVILELMYNSILLGEYAMDPNGWSTLKTMLGVSTSEVRQKFIRFQSGQVEFYLYMDHFPLMESREDYLRTIAPVPSMAHITMLREESLKQYFTYISNRLGDFSRRSKRLPSFLDPPHQPPVHLEDAREEIRDTHHRLFTKFARKQENFIPTWLRLLKHFLSFQKRDREGLSSLQSAWFRQSHFQFLSEKEWEIRTLLHEDLNDTDARRYSSQPEVKVDPDRGLVEFAIYSEKFNQVFLSTLPLQLIDGEIQLLRYFLSSLVFLSVLITLLFAIRITRSITYPVSVLVQEVESFATEPMKLPDIVLDSRDEFQRMENIFSRMAGITRERIVQLHAMNELHEAAIHLTEAKEVLELSSRIISEQFRCRGVYLVVFEQASIHRVFAQGGYQVHSQVVKKHIKDLNLSSFTPGDLLPLQAPEGSRRLQAIPMRFKFQPNSDNEETWYAWTFLLDTLEGWYDKENQAVMRSFQEQWMTMVHRIYQDRFQKDNVEGQQVQKRLLPNEKPDLEGWNLQGFFQAAQYLGGDFYDWRQEDDFLEVSVADVSGKGIGPALFSMHCKSGLELLCKDYDSDIQGRMHALNTSLCERGSRGLFATLFLARIELRTGKFRYCSAGHNQMILIRANGELEYLNAPGLPLGFLPDGMYRENEAQLQPGDFIVLYTDGVTELENPDLELFGLQRLEQSLVQSDPKNRRNSILHDLHQFRQERALSDDVTLILLERMV